MVFKALSLLFHDIGTSDVVQQDQTGKEKEEQGKLRRFLLWPQGCTRHKKRQYRRFVQVLSRVWQLVLDAYGPIPQAPSLQLLEFSALRHQFPLFALAQSVAALVDVFSLWPYTTERIGTEALSVWFVFMVMLILVIYLPSRRWIPEKRSWNISTGMRFAVRLLSVTVGGFWGCTLAALLPGLGAVGQSIIIAAMLLLTDAAIFLISVGWAPLLYSVCLNGVLLWKLGEIYNKTGQAFYFTSILAVISNFIFVVLVSMVLRVLLVGYQVNRTYLQQRDRILDLLLGGMEETRSDWLWETDTEGKLRNVASGLARVLHQSPSHLTGQPFVNLLYCEDCEGCHDGTSFGEESAIPHETALQRLRDCMERRIFFRDLVICVFVDGQKRFWSLSGRPVFRDQIFQGYGGVGTDVTKAHHAQKAALFQARHDVLTGLPNRAAFFEDMSLYLVRTELEEERFALFTLDLDGFKQINDRYGHIAGDEALKIVGARLAQVLGEQEELYRLGGDEFVVLEKGASVRSATNTARRLMGALDLPITLRDNIQCSLGVSIGIVMAEGREQSVEQLLNNADLALYECKRHEDSAYRFYQPGLAREVKRDRQMMRDLTLALENGQVDLVYQPFFDMQSQALLGFEALLSWKHPQYGRIPTEEIIQMAEEVSLMQILGLYVLRKALAFACTWPDGIMLSINISVSQLRSDSHRLDYLRVLDESPLPAHRLQLEVTETVAMEHSPAIYAKLGYLRDRGVSIALDDFGKGYSCLAYLQFFPFSKIKLDRLFVSDMLYNPRSTAIVKATIGLAVDLGVAVTAEGVETQEQYDFLARLGCTEVQGYYFSRPVSADTAMRMMKEPPLLKHERRQPAS